MEQALQDKIKASTAERVINGGLLVTGAAVTAVIGYFNPVTAGFFPACALYTTTGFFCPGCGLTRGFHALIHGDVLAAFHFNALWPFYAVLFSYVLLSALLVVFRGRGLGYRFFQPWMLYGFLALSVIFTVLRNIPGYPFSLLAPS